MGTVKMNVRVLLAALPFLLAPVARADVPPEAWQALQARVGKLEAEQLAQAAKTDRPIRIDGFVSAGFGWADTPDGLVYDTGLYDRVSHKADSVVGVQFDARASERASLVVQLVGRGGDDFAIGAEWAYVAWKTAAGHEFRAGRQRAPYYLLSEFLEVGYAYPWARPPEEYYRPKHPSSYDGFSWRKGFSSGALEHDLSLAWGSNRTESEGSEVKAEDSAMAALRSTLGDWQFGALVSHSKLTVDNPLFTALAGLPLDPPFGHLLSDDALYAAIGGQYDNGRLLLLGEFARINVERVIPDTESGYALVGYRFGKFMPHLTWAASRAFGGEIRRIPALPAFCTGPGTLCLDAAGTVPFPDDTLVRLLDRDQDSLALGLRYDFLPNAALKIDWKRVIDTGGTFGIFYAGDGSIFTAPFPDDDRDVFRVVIDAVF